MKKIGAFLLLLLFPLLAAYGSQTPLAPDQAFPLSAQLTPNNTIILNWKIAPQHYLYLQRFNFKVLQPKEAQIGKIIFPPSQTKQDNVLGTYQVYTGEINIPIPIVGAGNKDIILNVSYQGCSEAGYCYPPIQHQIKANFGTNAVTANGVVSQQEATNKITRLLQEKNLAVIFLGFVGFGLLLAFTPCVLPMIPILSGIILGHGHTISTAKAFRLSLVYVLSMSITYAIAGVLVGYIGGSLQAVFQKPWVIVFFSFIFVLMALSMFGLYNIQPPKKLETFLARLSEHQKKGHYLGVAIMGCLGTLIISPCVTPALVAALGYISQKGDMLLGGVALFATGLGTGIPLLFLGPAHKFLPKAGHWMTTVKSFVGVILLAVTILMLARILPGPIIMILWACLLIGCAMYLGALTNGTRIGWGKFWRGVGIILLAYGIVLLIGGTMGNSDPLKPFARKELAHRLVFEPIETIQDLSDALNRAKLQNKVAILDFYADWCVSCKEMDHTTFSDPQVKAETANYMLLRADVTANNAADKALMEKYNVIAPPTVLFFKSNGEEIESLRIVGETGPANFLQTLQQVNTFHKPK